MFTLVDVDNFDSEVLKEERPVLLAYIHRDHEYKEQSRILESVSEKFGSALKICLLDERSSRAFGKLGIEGDPTFIGFHKGGDKGRILGKASREALNTFVLLISAECPERQSP